MLPQTMEHQFTPEGIAPSNLDVILPYLEKLKAMPTDSVEDYEAFLRAYNELECWISQYVKDAQIRTVTHTDDEAAQNKWMRIISEVIPELSPWDDLLGKKVLAAKAATEFEKNQYGPYLRQTKVGVELFREENIKLSAQISEFTNSYQKVCGAWVIEFRGEKYPRPAMSKFLMDPDRETRREAWDAVNKVTLADAGQLDDIFEQLYSLRMNVARNCGFDNFRDYIFKQKMRDYGPDECFAYHDLIEAEVVPLLQEITESTRNRLGLDSFRPWDTQAEPDGGAPLKPFSNATELQDGVERMMRRLDPDLGEQFHLIRDFQDLDSRPAKAPGGFMATLPWQRRPYIFANASGVHRDIITLLHEAGHAFHMLASVDNQPMAGTQVPMEFNEVASMAMELMHYDTLDEFYGENDQQRAIHQHLRRLPSLLVSVAKGDAFQHQMYTHPEHTRQERYGFWEEQGKRFGSGVNWDGLDPALQSTSWHSILHFFEVPFYFIEYGFAQLGALQVAVAAEKDAGKALANYKHALTLGPQKDTFGLYQAAGAEFIPTQEKVKELMDWIRSGLGL